MLFLVCLFFATYSYASEDSPLLEVIVEDASPVLQQIKEKYDNHNKEYCKNNQVHFYNSAVETVQSFQSNEEIINLFSEISSVKELSTITQLPAMQSMLQKHKLYHNLADNLNLLFKSIDRFDFSEDQHFKNQILYHFKLFFYNIELNQDSSIKVSSYNDFLKSSKKCTLNVYDITLQSEKEIMFGAGGGMAILGALGIGLSIAFPKVLSIILPMYGCPALLFHCVTGACYLRKYYAYKHFLKIIEELQQDIQNE